MCELCVCVSCVSIDSLSIWQVQVSVYCARRIPTHLMCTQCSILLHIIDIFFLPCNSVDMHCQVEDYMLS